MSCKYCMPEDTYNQIYNQEYSFFDKQIFVGAEIEVSTDFRDDWAVIYTYIEDSEHTDPPYHEKFIKIKYCPFCGRKLVSDRVKENE